MCVYIHIYIYTQIQYEYLVTNNTNYTHQTSDFKSWGVPAML